MVHTRHLSYQHLRRGRLDRFPIRLFMPISGNRSLFLPPVWKILAFDSISAWRYHLVFCHRKERCSHDVSVARIFDSRVSKLLSRRVRRPAVSLEFCVGSKHNIVHSLCRFADVVAWTESSVAWIVKSEIKTLRAAGDLCVACDERNCLVLLRTAISAVAGRLGLFFRWSELREVCPGFLHMIGRLEEIGRQRDSMLIADAFHQ